MILRYKGHLATKICTSYRLYRGRRDQQIHLYMDNGHRFLNVFAVISIVKSAGDGQLFCHLLYYLYHFSRIICMHCRVDDLLYVVMTDLSVDTGIHVSDVVTTMQSLGVISVAGDTHRCV